jgi:hypothetical protein
VLFQYPGVIKLDSDNNLFVVDGGRCIRKVDHSSGAVSTVFGTCSSSILFVIVSIAVDASGTLYIAQQEFLDRSTVRLYKLPKIGDAIMLAERSDAGDYYAVSVDVDAGGSFLYIACATATYGESHKASFIYKFDISAQTFTLYAGDPNGAAGVSDGIGTGAQFNLVLGIALDTDGVLYVADTTSKISGPASPVLIRTVSPKDDGLSQTSTMCSDCGVWAGGASIAIALGSFRSVFLATQTPSPIVVFRSSFSVVCDSTWHHAALTRGDTASPNTIAFLDGLQILSAQVTFNMPADGSSTLQLSQSGAAAFTGSLADLRIYNRALSADEVLALSQPARLAVTNSIMINSLGTNDLFPAATSYSWLCTNAHYSAAGGIATLARNSVDGSWSFANSAQPDCSLACAFNSKAYTYFGCSAGSTTCGTQSCLQCALGSTLASGVCAPSGAQTSGPADSSFYFSGSQVEGIGAFPFVSNPSGLSWQAGPSGSSNSAISFSRSTAISALPLPSSPLLAALPTGNGAFTLSARFKCVRPSVASTMPLSSWGSPGSSVALRAGASSAQVPGYTATIADGAAAGVTIRGRIAVDSEGFVFVADTLHAIRVVSPLGEISILAGSNVPGFLDGIGTSALFNSPRGLAVDGGGIIYVADFSNFCIRVIKRQSGSAIVSTIAGSGIGGVADGTAAQFANPNYLAVDVDGAIYVADGNLSAKLHQHKSALRLFGLLLPLREKTGDSQTTVALLQSSTI